MSWQILLDSMENISVRPADIADILVVSFILYRLFVLIEGTLAVQMLAGLVVLFGVSLASDFLNLYTLNWILRNFWSIWVLALIVLFQPELRRILAQVGQRGFLTANERQDLGEDLIEEVVQAVKEMSSSRTGALIVFERKTGLRLYREMGVELDAQVRADLIRSIFNSRSPLHDGAVIIKDDRLVAAACFLPLTKSPHLGTSIGTRHRAAVGITEETDAVVVVVSEETGRISVAISGRFVQDLTPETLRKILRRVYLEGKGASSRSSDS